MSYHRVGKIVDKGSLMAKVIFGSQIKEALEVVKPNRVAVAYLGIDWRDYITNPEKLEAVIVSPTLGTNPEAVKQLARIVTWEKLFFLKELHAKVYVGNGQAIVGSANLTANGLSGVGLLECGVLLSETTELDAVGEAFSEIMERSITQFPTVNDRKRQLAKLYQAWNKAIDGGFMPKPKHNNTGSIHEFELFNTRLVPDAV